MNMQQMMRQAQKMQKELQKAQQEIAEMTFEGTAGGGMVTAVARGRQIQSSPLPSTLMVVDPEDVEMLQDMVCAAVNEALRGVDQMGSARMRLRYRRSQHPRYEVIAIQ